MQIYFYLFVQRLIIHSGRAPLRLLPGDLKEVVMDREVEVVEEAVVLHVEGQHVLSHQEVDVVTIGHHCRLHQRVETEVEVL